MRAHYQANSGEEKEEEEEDSKSVKDLADTGKSADNSRL